jgi:hypothetical protein
MVRRRRHLSPHCHSNGTEKTTPPCIWKTEKCIDLFGAQTDVYRWRHTKVCARCGRKQISITSCSFEQARAKSDIRHHSAGRRMRAELSHPYDTHTRKHKELIYIAQHSTGNCSAERRLMNYLLSRALRKCRIVLLAWVSACMYEPRSCQLCRRMLRPSAGNQSSCVGEVTLKGRRQEWFRNVVAQSALIKVTFIGFDPFIKSVVCLSKQAMYFI